MCPSTSDREKPVQNVSVLTGESHNIQGQNGPGLAGNQPNMPATTTISIAIIEKPIRQVSAFTVLFLLPSSLTRKKSPENKLAITASSKRTTTTLTSSICGSQKPKCSTGCGRPREGTSTW